MPGTPGSATQVDDLSWRLWWRFNGGDFLQLKRAVHRLPTETTGDDLFRLGKGERARSRGLAPSSEQLDLITAALAQSLATETANDALSGALVALSKIGRRPAESARVYLARFEALLSHGSQEISETAALALGLSGEVGCFELLRAVALDTPQGRKAVGQGRVPLRTRAFATYGLGYLAAELGPGPVSQAIALDLISIYAEPSSSTHDLPVAAWLSLSQVDLGERLQPPPRGADRRPLSGAEHVLSRGTLLEWFAAQLTVRDLDHRLHAHGLTTVARLARGNDQALTAVVPVLLEPLGRGSSAATEVRQSAILALGLVGDCDGDSHDVDLRRALQREVSDGQPGERRFALMALARVAARDGRGENAGQARGELRQRLLVVLARGKSGLKPWAGLALGVLGYERLAAGDELDRSTTLALRSALGKERSPENLLAYAMAIGLRRDIESKSLLMGKFERLGDPRDSGELAIALGLLGEASVAPFLRERLAKAKYRPRELELIAVGLAILGDKQAALTLDGMLGEARSLGSQAAVAQALGAIGDHRSFATLLALLRDKGATESARAFAAVGLGDLADRRALPWGLPLSRHLGYRALTLTLVGDGNGVLDLR
jgi:hypothetical protein